jgi:hypothetical protein
MALEITGKLIKILPEQTGSGKNGNWVKQEFVIETTDKYPKKVCCSLWGDKIATLKNVPSDVMLKVSFNIESREYNERWYTELRAWNVEVLSSEGNSGSSSSTTVAPTGDITTFTADSSETEDLPF